MTTKSIKNLATLISLAVLGWTLVLLTGCEEDNSARAQQEEARDSIMERANTSVPVPRIQNFQTRETIAKWMRRNDDVSRVFYVYVVADTGQILGYYTSSTRPVNYASFLTPPDTIQRTGATNPNRILRQAPAVDGVYYGEGSGDNWFFFDAETDALIEIVGLNLFVADQPLELDAEPIVIRSEQESEEG